MKYYYKIPDLFLREEFLEFTLTTGKETYFSILVENIPPFEFKTKSSACFSDKF